MKNCIFRRTCEILVDFGLKKSEILQTLHFQWCFRLRTRFQWHVAWIRNTDELFPTSDATDHIFKVKLMFFSKNQGFAHYRGDFLLILAWKSRKFLEFSISVGDFACGVDFCDPQLEFKTEMMSFWYQMRKFALFERNPYFSSKTPVGLLVISSFAVQISD